MNRSSPSPWTTRGLYLFGLVLVLAPLSDLLTTVWPLLPGQLGWRYGFLGLSAGYLHTPMLGLIVVLGAAHWERNGPLLRWLGYAMCGVASLLLVAMGVFLLDLLQMRDLRAEEVQRGMIAGGLLQEAKYGTASLVLFVLGIGCVKEATLVGRGSGRRRSATGVVNPSQ